jgi:hypothetical protein
MCAHQKFRDKPVFFVACVKKNFGFAIYARQVWLGCLMALGVNVAIPSTEDSLQSWWKAARVNFRRREKRCFDSLVILIACRLWMEAKERQGVPKPKETVLGGGLGQAGA